MKRLYAPLTFLLILFAFGSCQKEFSSNTGIISLTENTLPEPVSVTLQGNVSDENGEPAANVNIKAGSATTTTNVNGYFRIVNAPLDKNASLVIAEAPGYFRAYRTFQATSGVNQVSIKLIRKTLSGTISATSGGEIHLANNSKISLPVNGIVKVSGGESFTGIINVYAAYIDPAGTDISKIIPGSFMGNDKNNRRVVLKSYGMLAVELESANGEKLQIAPGKTAKLTFPLTPSNSTSAPLNISLWYVDEQTGIWKEEGTATKTGNDYVGDVKHFSFWNCDFSSTAIKLSMTVKDAKGQPIVYANVQVRMSDSGGIAHGYTDSLGQVSGLVPSNANLTLDVLDECYNVIFSKNIGPFNQNTDMGNITVANSSSSVVTVIGKLLNCSNAIVSDGYAIINFNNIIRYADVNDKGEFSSTFVKCSGSSVSCNIAGVDITSQQQGNAKEVNLTSAITDASDILACGTSVLEYINYTLDGVNYSISSTARDSLNAYVDPGLITYIQGTHSPDTHISFTFINSVSTGTFPIENLYVQNYTVPVVQPLVVNLTSYPQNSGEFYEGKFSGQFTDSLITTPVHSISCSFKIRKY